MLKHPNCIYKRSGDSTLLLPTLSPRYLIAKPSTIIRGNYPNTSICLSGIFASRFSTLRYFFAKGLLGTFSSVTHGN